MNSQVTDRFITCYEDLKQVGIVRSARQFALTLDFHPQSWNEILKGRRDVTLTLIESAVSVYKINPHYLFTGEGHRIGEGSDSRHLRVLSVVTDQEGNENIAHVPIKAVAGYAANAANLQAFSSLMTYSLPGMEHRFGTFRSFEIEGMSMVPTIYPGAMVVCRYVQPDLWLKQILDDHVYVVVTAEELVIKRLKNRIADQKAVHLHSDSHEFEPYIMVVDDIRELWYVERIIQPFDHVSTKPQRANHDNTLVELIRIQSELIKRIQTNE